MKPRTKAAWTVLVLHLITVFLPLLVIAVWAFTATWPWPNLLPGVFSGRGIVEIFRQQPGMGATILRSVCIALVTGILSTTVAALAARALANYRFRGRTLLRFSVMLPFLIPVTVFAMGVQVAFIRMGLADTALGVILAHTVIALPYSILLLTDVTAAAGTRLEEQARTLGAGFFAAFFRVQVPQLIPGLLASLSMAYILSFSQYFLTLLIGGGAVKTLALIMFPYLTSGDRTIASAYGLLFLIISLVVFLVFELLLRRHTLQQVDYFN